MRAVDRMVSEKPLDAVRECAGEPKPVQMLLRVGLPEPCGQAKAEIGRQLVQNGGGVTARPVEE